VPTLTLRSTFACPAGAGQAKVERNVAMGIRLFLGPIALTGQPQIIAAPIC
jgi:hypothetical protein